MDFAVQPLKTIRKECKTPAAMPGFSFEQIGAGDRLVHCERRGSLQRHAEKPATSR
jgi:hypothetical protein